MGEEVTALKHVFLKPSELDANELACRDVALAVGRAVVERHSGTQIDHKINGTVIEITAKHPAHTFAFGVDLSNPEIKRDPTKHAQHIAMSHYVEQWTSRLLHVMRHVSVTNADGNAIQLADGITALSDLMRRVQKDKRKFIFIGNGGSAAIASHMAEDFTKNGHVRAVTFNDAALLTCYANDYGWDEVFAKCTAHHAVSGDVLVAISSSGKSLNIKAAVTQAKLQGIVPVTFSGFDPDNPLRNMGQLNFHVPSMQYGFVETAHAALLHMTLDIFNGWVGQK